MTRLPIPGSDDGIWAGILNEYLLKGHSEDGTHDIKKLLSVPSTDGKIIVSDSSAASGIAWQSIQTVPAGGTAGQVLQKASSDDGDYDWSALTKNNVGLDNVDNTSDTDKPVSTAQQSAIDTKANISHSHTQSDVTGLSENLAGKQPLDPTLTALATFDANGLLAQTATDTFVARTITGTTNQVTVTNGNGVAGNPTLSLPQNIHTGAQPTFASTTFGASSGVDYGLKLTPTIGQSATAGYAALYINSTESTIGSGERKLAQFQTGGVDRLRIYSDGRVLSQPRPESTSGDSIGYNMFTTRQQGTVFAGTYGVACTGNVTGGTAGTGSGWAVGGKFNGRYDGAGNIGKILGGWFVAETGGTGSGTLDSAIAGNFTVYRGVGNTHTLTNAIGILIDNPTSGGDTITNAYGIKIADQTAGTNNWALYTGTGQVRFGDDVNLYEGKNLVTGTTTGTKIASATNQKLGFFGATPVVQPTGTPTNATDLATVITLVNDLKTKLTTLGLIA